MGILIKMARHRAIKKMAKKMPPFLVSGYGYQNSYSEGQIDRAIRSTGCNVVYKDYAIAMFGSQVTFEGISDKDYTVVHQEVADVCFFGNNNFTASDTLAMSSDYGVSGDSMGGSD